ncbi:MAG: ATP-grasp domain-containing protein [Bacteroidales bacterium]|nr:ATP-grasp domain-containing protein [Bacteroidales bacterium]MDD3890764.1 ATP-grasp domain-containing protein [Bacteroidales bacterium]
MFIIDEPYVSELFKDTIIKNRYKLLKNEFALKSEHYDSELLYDNEQMIEAFKSNQLLYLNSENSIEWIADNLSFSELPQHINVFKNKALFRDMTRKMYPNFYYKQLDINELRSFKVDEVKKPFIIKPAVGFLSLGVYTVNSNNDWVKTVELIEKEMVDVKSMFPKEVLDTSKFIIEEYIDGTEYAFDAYYDNEGKPVIINILKHIFASTEDVSDRLYLTSKSIINEFISPFQEFLEEIGDILKIRNIPIHVEVRVNGDTIVPIEVNPMRFAGLCTTDIAYFAYGINPYEYFIERKKPDWNSILKNKDGKVYSVTILDKPKDIDASAIKQFDFERVLKSFEKPLEVRKMDIKRYPIFGFVFAETRKENLIELENILKNDLREFIKL